MSKKSQREAEERAARRAAFQAKAHRFQLGLGYAIVAVSAVLGFLVHPAVGVGLTILAVLRIALLRREMRREAEDSEVSKDRSTKRQIPSRLSPENAGGGAK